MAEACRVACQESVLGTGMELESMECASYATDGIKWVISIHEDMLGDAWSAVRLVLKRNPRTRGNYTIFYKKNISSLP